MVSIQQVKSGTSVLMQKFPKGKISPKSLGYVRPDGKINFATKEAAATYAKNRVVSPLNIGNPFERGKNPSRWCSSLC